MKLSAYQERILEFAAAPDGSAVIEAVAGSGKTFTVVEVAKRLRGSRMFLAFNRSIAQELSRRVPNAMTLNAIGYRALAKHSEVDPRKVHKMLPTGTLMGPELCRLISGAKAFGMLSVDQQAVEALADYFDLDLSETELDSSAPIINDVLRRCLSERETVDFNDQVWIPAVTDMALPVYDSIIVDEAQDLSRVQRMMIRKLTGQRLFAVGDSFQSVYKFRGADSGSMHQIRREFSAISLPLSITYRCPLNVVAYASKLVPHLEAAENAMDGAVVCGLSLSVKSIAPGDLVVCRNNAPLIKLYYKMLGQGVPTAFVGRDAAKELIRLIERIGYRHGSFLSALSAWREQEVTRHISRGHAERAASVNDRYESLMALYAHTKARNPEDLVKSVQAMMVADAKIMLSTIHRAKGLEANRVWLLEPQLLPAHYGDEQQERNLEYVAITRAKSSLVLIRASDLR